MITTMENKTSKTKPTFIAYLLAGGGLLVLVGVLIAIVVNSQPQAGIGFSIIRNQEPGLYLVQAPDNVEISEWKYAIMENGRDCNSSGFQNNGQDDSHNGADLNFFIATVEQLSTDHNKWICFAVKADGDWHYIAQELTTASSVECVDGQVAKAGVCVDVCEGKEGDDNTYVLVGDACEVVSDPYRYKLVAERFEDVSVNDEHAEAIGFLLEREIAIACYEDSFCPSDLMTRAEFITWIYRLFDQSTPSSVGSELFNDVEAGYYADDIDEAIGWAYEVGITTGCDEDLFCPERTLIRAEAAVFIYRSVADPTLDDLNLDLNFEDVDENAYYADAASWAIDNDIMYYCGDPFFCPGDSVTRGETASIIYRSVTAGYDRYSSSY